LLKKDKKHVPSKKDEELEEGFLKVEEELHEYEEKRMEGDVEHVEEQLKSLESVTDYEQLPYDVVHKIIRATCLVALVVWFGIIVFLTIITLSDPFNTLIGLSPVLLTIIVTYILVDKYHMESGFLMVFPFIFTGIFLLLGVSNMLEGMDYRTLSSVNIIFGLLFEAAVIIHYSILRRQKRAKFEEGKKQEKTEEKKLIIKLEDEDGLKSFVSSIEDKSKAINAAIGRVYSVRHGGTEPLRKKIKIDATHYNEFNQLRHEVPEHRKAIAIKLLKKIKARLELLQKPEHEVFDKDDLTGLINLIKDPEGKDEIIEILVRNDKDPVDAYYKGALEFCSDALKELEKEEKK